MKTIIFSIFFLTIFNRPGLSQQLQFQKTYGGLLKDQAKTIRQTNDSGYIIAGYTDSSPADSGDVYLIKTDVNGDTLWTSIFGGVTQDWANSIQQTNDGGYILVGGTYSYGAFNELIFLNKLDANGNLAWSKTLGGTSINDAYCVEQTMDGGYIISGVTLSYGAGNGDIYLIKTNSTGDTTWTHTYGAASGLEYGSSVQQTIDGGYIVGGYTTSFGTGTDMYIVKTDFSGTIEWTKSIGGAGYDRGNEVRQTSDGGYAIVGYTNSFGAGGWDILYVQTDQNGLVSQSFTYGTANDELGFSIKQTDDTGYVIAANASINAGDIQLLKLDSAAGVVWSKTYGGVANDWVWQVIQTIDGGYATTRGSMSFGAGDEDVYVIKTDANGESGCNDADFPITATFQSLLSVNTATLISSGGVISSVSPAMYHGATVSTLCTNMGIENITELQFSLYPNPFTTSAILKLSSELELNGAELKIFDLHGNLIQKILSIYSSEIELNKNNMVSGIYFYMLEEKGNILSMGKIMVE